MNIFGSGHAIDCEIHFWLGTRRPAFCCVPARNPFVDTLATVRNSCVPVDTLATARNPFDVDTLATVRNSCLPVDTLTTVRNSCVPVDKLETVNSMF